jgi:hypothetical protein
MSASLTLNAADSRTALTAHSWSPQPEPARLVQSWLDDLLQQSPFAANLSRRMLDETGTRLLDWIDHFGLPGGEGVVAELTRVGYIESVAVPSTKERAFADRTTNFWEHPRGLFPRVRIHTEPVRHVAIKVESVVDFLAAHRLTQIEIEGPPLAALRRACIAREHAVELWAVERHGTLGFEPLPDEAVPLEKLLLHREALRLRQREFDTDAVGFAHATNLVAAASADVGRDRACDLFFTAEREYWLRRNQAGRIQKARQDALGLGWANHDHHTYRSSRHCFSELIAFLERLGFVCRERFYAGREAGWGAQVIEHPVTGVVIFADVDLSPEEVSQDFAHEPLPPRDRLDTVGLWCGLHGEAFLQAGLHHLECQFDYEATRFQLQRAGIEAMPPFTDFPYLRQAFTRGEQWPVRPERIDRLLVAHLITDEQAQQFRNYGAIGSHLEILQRNDGYKGFNQTGISEIISATDPRLALVGS